MVLFCILYCYFFISILVVVFDIFIVIITFICWCCVWNRVRKWNRDAWSCRFGFRSVFIRERGFIYLFTYFVLFAISSKFWWYSNQMKAEICHSTNSNSNLTSTKVYRLRRKNLSHYCFNDNTQVLILKWFWRSHRFFKIKKKFCNIVSLFSYLVWNVNE